MDSSAAARALHLRAACPTASAGLPGATPQWLSGRGAFVVLELPGGAGCLPQDPPTPCGSDGGSRSPHGLRGSRGWGGGGGRCLVLLAGAESRPALTAGPAGGMSSKPGPSCRAGRLQTGSLHSRPLLLQMLDENHHLIQCILDYQSKGKTAECTQ